MSVEVVTVWAPRPQHAKWRDYLPLIRLQKATAEHFGHRHTVVTDTDLGSDLEQLRVPLGLSLMPAMIEGVIARLRYPRMNTYLVFVDADCLINRDLHEAFGADFELGLTRREHETSAINNGAMYVALGAHHLAAAFFDRALARCGDYWGADQEAISAEAAPVPTENVVELRGPLRVGFLSMRSHNAVPKIIGRKHWSNPFVVHFKGEDKKGWAEVYAEKFILRRS